jgi:hypothetical protein
MGTNLNIRAVTPAQAGAQGNRWNFTPEFPLSRE